MANETLIQEMAVRLVQDTVVLNLLKRVAHRFRAVGEGGCGVRLEKANAGETSVGAEDLSGSKA